jgi:fatty-acid peroxygenase
MEPRRANRQCRDAAIGHGDSMRSEIGFRLLRDGYDALARLRESAGGADWFEARMLGRRALVVRGTEGVRTFYDPELVTRKGAIPAPMRLMLFGKGAVHGLNGRAHRQRKQMYLDVVGRESVGRLSGQVSRRVEKRMAGWDGKGSVRLFDELVQVYGAAVIAWAGIDIDDAEARAVSKDLAALVDGFGVRGTGYVRGYTARFRANRWARQQIRQARQASPGVEGTVLDRVAANRALSESVAAVELLNILRPTVAVAYFGAFSAHALERHPEWRERLAEGEPAVLRAFAHEVRRCYPFVPLLTGRLVKECRWQGGVLPRRGFMVLDVIGTNQDPGRWDRPTTFDPERFLGREPDAYEYVPQGGGDPAHGHRCPGEPLAVGILEATVRELARTDFSLASESRIVPLRRIPSLPPRGLELREVRRSWVGHPA